MDIKTGTDTQALLRSVQEVCKPASARLVVDTVEVQVEEVDPLASASEVAKAVGDLSLEPVEESAVRLTRTWNGTLLARVQVSGGEVYKGGDAEKAATSLQGRYLKVKYTSCLVRMSQVVPASRQQRCFRCLEFGHLQATCRNEEDRSTWCIRCGKPDHLARDCKEDVCCAKCKGPHRVGHQDCSTSSA
ncbi:uncharacterized protein LOC125764035 [Anopheles funestus]|uniref:uncharacterized protein LOC125764035 n=1 Tax=Anopheles funestus TaxID=62324 RepID=UPI0020C6B708|nr:uncharacterized protein LOC125764035 [Anopheles funestus]